MSWIVAVIPRWLVLGGFYLVLTGEASGAEIAAAVLVGGIAAALSLQLRRAARRHFTLRVPWHRIAAGVLWSLVRDVVRVQTALAAALFSRRGGMLVRQRSGLPVGRQAARAGRRASEILAASVAPNEYVIDDERGALVLHRLAGGARGPDEKQLA